MLCGKLTSRFFTDNNNVNNYKKHNFIFTYSVILYSSIAFRTRYRYLKFYLLLDIDLDY